MFSSARRGSYDVQVASAAEGVDEHGQVDGVDRLHVLLVHVHQVRVAVFRCLRKRIQAYIETLS